MCLKGLFVLAVSFISVSSLFSTNTKTITRCARGQCESGVGLYPHCDDCRKFIYCIFGHPVVKTCPNDLQFDITRAVCNYPAHSKCWDPSNIVDRDRFQPDGRYNQDSLKTPPNARLSQEESGQLQHNYGYPMKSGDILVKPKVNEPSRNNLIPQRPNDGPPTETYLDGREFRRQSVDSRANGINIPQLPNGDVSVMPVSMQTDDPPLGFDQDGHEVNHKNVDAPANGIGIPQLSNLYVSAVPVSMRTDDPPLGFDQDGHEVNHQNVDAPANRIRIPQLSNGDVSAVPVSMRTDDPPLGFDQDGHEVDRQIVDAPSNGIRVPKLSNGDVSAVPVSMRTDDPPLGFDQDGHEVDRQNVVAPANEIRVRQLSNGDVTVVPVSMRTDDPPLGFDQDGYELRSQNFDAPANGKGIPQLPNGDVSAVPLSKQTGEPAIGYDENGYGVRNKVADSFPSMTENNQRQHPNGDVSLVPVSMKTDDPPTGYDNEGHELRPHNSDSKQSNENVDSLKVSESEHKNDKVDEPEMKLEELATLGTDDPPEDWNRDYTINPDFEGLEKSEQLTGESDKSLSDIQKDVNSQSSQSDGEVSQLNLPLLPADVNSPRDKNLDLPNLQLLGGSFELPILGKSALNEKLATAAPTADSLVPCVVNCSGLTAGLYQSCTDCSSYVSCIIGFMFTNTCPTNNYWDDIIKQCVPKSSTCN
ncbi:hypothetical protein SNE40_016730 [Patella caerulea]|uniref:Chitin-binding type-2 domain-containing protein n=1 Tax=Patella caerulea TaxID=87958 RepID=A0AAN8JEV5_PATCE